MASPKTQSSILEDVRGEENQREKREKRMIPHSVPIEEK